MHLVGVGDFEPKGGAIGGNLPTWIQPWRRLAP